MSKEDEQSSAKDVIEEVEEAVEKAIEEVKEEAADSSSVSSAANETMSSAKDMLESAKSWAGTAGSAIGKTWSTVGEWKEEGTPLRGYIKGAREGLDDATAKLRMHAELLDQKTRQRVNDMKKDINSRFEEFDKSGVLAKSGEVGRQHPELIVGGVTLGVALPSSLVGRGLRNGALAFTLSAGVVYGGSWFQRRILPKLKGEKDDDESKRP